MKKSHFVRSITIALIFLFPLLLEKTYANDDVIQGFKSLGNEILIDSSIKGLKKKIFRYGNWYGPGYWGGSDNPTAPGSKGPVDSLDEVAMRHDFAYLLAEQQGAIYGKEEELRLKGIADKIAVEEAKALPDDPRKWPNPPKGSVDYEDIKGYRQRMIGGFTLEKEGYKHASTFAKLDRINNDKLGAILDVTDQKQKFNEEDIKRRVKTLAKNWKNVTDFERATEDSKLTIQQKKELFKKFRQNPQGFPKTYADYKKKNGVLKSDAQIAQDKQTAAIAKKYKVYPDDLLQFFNCVCRSSGGSLGGYYGPAKGGPCVASGPLSSWNTVMPTSKKVILPCLNQIDADNYKEDQKIFDSMRQNDARVAQQRLKGESDYPKYVKLIQEENAKSAEAELSEVKELIKTQRQTWEEDTLRAARLFNRIKDVLLEKDRLAVQGILTPRLRNLAQMKITKGELKSAITALEFAVEAGGPRVGSATADLQQSKKWLEAWKNTRTKEFPEIRKKVTEGKVVTARQRVDAISFKMSTQGGNQLPPISSNLEWNKLKNSISQKADEMAQYLWETRKSATELASYQQRDPKAAIKLIDAFPKSWEIKSDLQNERGFYAEQIRKAADFAAKGETALQKELLQNALINFQKSVNIQKDTGLQGKIDKLLGAAQRASQYRSEGDAARSKSDLSGAISKYTSSVALWPDPNLTNIINQLQQQLLAEKTRQQRTNTAQAEKKSSAGGKKDGVCRADDECPPGYVCDRGTGKCGSPFDEGYSSFGKISITRDDQRSQYQASRTAVSQTPAQKRGFSSDDFEKELGTIQEKVALPPTQASIDSPAIDSGRVGDGRSGGGLVSAASAVVTDTPKTLSKSTPAGTPTASPKVTSQTPIVSGNTPVAKTKPANSSMSNGSNITDIVPTTQAKPPATTSSNPSPEDSGFNPKEFLGLWNYSGSRPDGKKRSGTMSFYLAGTSLWSGGTMAYTIVDEDGQSNGKGNGNWTLEEESPTVKKGPSDTTIYTFNLKLTLNLGGKTWTGPVTGDEDNWTFNSSHGTYTFRK